MKRLFVVVLFSIVTAGVSAAPLYLLIKVPILSIDPEVEVRMSPRPGDEDYDCSYLAKAQIPADILLAGYSYFTEGIAFMGASNFPTPAQIASLPVVQVSAQKDCDGDFDLNILTRVQGVDVWKKYHLVARNGKGFITDRN